MTRKTCILVGAPMDCGKRRMGCLMGPDAYRTAGLGRELANLGHKVEDLGNLTPAAHEPDSGDTRLYAPRETIGWTHRLMRVARESMARGLPIFLGGDHALSMGSVTGVAAYAAEQNRPQFVLWLDAHSDFNTAETTESGNLHGTPVAYAAGRKGFPGFPAVPAPVPEENICMIGLRSVDAPEKAMLQETQISCHDMREIDETGIATPLAAFLDKVAAANGFLHVSLDVDFLDPTIAPAVGTTVPGGATIREAHLVMEMICDSGLMTSLDLVELNPFLDERGRTAQAMVDLAASALGRRVFDRPTRAFA
ncbi:arginase [Primorskyibacter aestuariivivens]|uniref:arginase n=1 Tax=Primorskyibacter aestuariivivens TaxID=1888912 RepID=UPI0023005C19|nr:arginase [Primorskyibacter aestuariivivens]MDA7429843.1 arginase [Primorskyibacter aestuariivivens]